MNNARSSHPSYFTTTSEGMLSERIFFVIGSIGDLFEIFEYDNDINIRINKLIRKLRLIHTYVRGIEEREDKQLNEWLSLENIAGDAEHILIYLKYGTNPTNPTISEITDLIQSIDRIASPNSITVNTGNNFNSGSHQVTGSVTVNVGTRSQNGQTRVAKRPSYGHLKNCDIVGFEGEIETLLSHIQDYRARVVGIVGMAGSGKTTLAKHLLHHADIQKFFGYKVWVCISQSWNKMEVLYEIFRQTAEAKEKEPEKIKSWSEQKLLKELYDALSEQSYLIILDDLWSVDAWNEISPGIPLSKASKVVVTTRNGVVPKHVDPAAFFILETKPLNPVQSYELFRGRAFTNEDEDVQEVPFSELVEVGKEMVEKCRGLPLAITALAGALGVNKSLNHWMKMSETLTQKILEANSTNEGMVREVLELSYHDLPYHLKQCFLYLAMFPEDHEIRTRMLMKMWIAECLISRDPLPEEEAMQRAEDYLDDLCNRYLIINVKRNCKEQVKAFQLHDLVREMCIKKANEKGFLNESHRVAFCYDCYELPWLDKEPWLQPQDEFRTLIPAKYPHLLSLNLSVQNVEDFFREMKFLARIIKPVFEFKFLRVLSLVFSNCFDSCQKLPNAMGELVHLRYLCLTSSPAAILPETLGNLSNLLTLDLNMCGLGQYFSNINLWKLKHLRHLHLGPVFECDWRMLQLNKLKNLRTLSGVKGGDWMLSEMRGLSSTLQKLCVRDIKRQEELEAVFRCPSIMCGNIQKLKLDWIFSKAELRNMEALGSCEKLWKLSVSGNLRKGITLVFPPKLVKLEIYEARLNGTDLMSVLGNYRCLRVLILGSNAYNGTTLTCNAVSFPQLEYLEFTVLSNLRFWTVEKGAMPSLTALSINDCVSLSQPPEGWRFVSKLQVVKASDMSARFEESLQQWRVQHPYLTISTKKTRHF